MIQTEHPLPVTRRCALLDVARSTAYYRPQPVSDEDLRLMRLIDEIHLELPFYGSRRMAGELEDRGHGPINRKHVQRLMCQMGLVALASGAYHALDVSVRRLALAYVRQRTDPSMSRS